MFYPPAQLTGCRDGVGLVILWVCAVAASSGAALQVQIEPIPDVCGFSNVEARVAQDLRPPVPIFDFNRTLSRPFEDDLPVRAQQPLALPNPPERVDSRSSGEFWFAPLQYLRNRTDVFLAVHRSSLELRIRLPIVARSRRGASGANPKVLVTQRDRRIPVVSLGRGAFEFLVGDVTPIDSLL